MSFSPTCYFSKSLVAKDRSTIGTFPLAPSQFAKHFKSNLYTCERFFSPCVVKPYFDFDDSFKHKPRPDTIETLLSSFKLEIERIFESQPSRVPPRIVTGYRHGPNPKKKGEFKVSFRAWVTNYKIEEYTLIPAMLDAMDCPQQFDRRPYKPTEQLLCCINCGKCPFPIDGRVLLPHDPDVPLSDYVVQHLDGNEELFVVPSVADHDEDDEGGIADAFALPMLSDDDEEKPPNVIAPAPATSAVTPAAKKASSAPKKKKKKDKDAAPVPGKHDEQMLAHPINKVDSTKMAVKYLHLLSKHRWDNRSFWVQLAIILKNEYGDELKEEWFRLSRLSPNFDDDEAAAAKVWDTCVRDTFEGSKLTLATLIKWAREDDPVGCNVVRVDEVPVEYLERCLDGDRGLAEIVHHRMQDRIKRCGKDKVFYVFDETKCVWTMGDRDITLNPVSRELESVLVDIKSHYFKKIKEASKDGNDDGTVARAMNEKISKVASTITRIQKSAGVASVMNFASPLFHDKEFEQLLDGTPYLVGVRNGMVDLRTGEVRPRAPEDNIFTVLDVAYDPAASTAVMHDLVMSIMAGNEAKVDYLQLLLGYGITGETGEEIFAVFTGSGRCVSVVCIVCLVECAWSPEHHFDFITT